MGRRVSMSAKLSPESIKLGMLSTKIGPDSGKSDHIGTRSISSRNRSTSGRSRPMLGRRWAKSDQLRQHLARTQPLWPGLDQIWSDSAMFGPNSPKFGLSSAKLGPAWRRNDHRLGTLIEQHRVGRKSCVFRGVEEAVALGPVVGRSNSQGFGASKPDPCLRAIREVPLDACRR